MVMIGNSTALQNNNQRHSFVYRCLSLSPGPTVGYIIHITHNNTISNNNTIYDITTSHCCSLQPPLSVYSMSEGCWGPAEGRC